MTLKEALDFVDIGHQHILIVDKNSNEYYYHSLEDLESDYPTIEGLYKLEVTNIDADGYNDTVVFYLW